MSVVSKKMISALLSVVLVFGFVPTAWADQVGESLASGNRDTAQAEPSQDATDAANNAASGTASEKDNSSAGSAAAEATQPEAEATAEVAETTPVAETPKTIVELAQQYKGTIAEGTYFINSSLISSKCLDVASASTKNSAKVQLYSGNHSKAQRFTISYDAQGYATLTNVNSGKALDVASGKSANGTKVQQYTSNGTKAQKWVIVPAANGGYTILSALGNNIALDVASGKTANGTAIQIYTSNGTAAQTWTFDSVDATFTALDNQAVTAKAGAGLIDGGTYYIETAQQANKVLDIASGSTSNGARLQIYDSNMTAAQKFRVQYDEKGYVTFINEKSGKALDVASGNLEPGTKVQQYTSNGTLAQKWIVQKNSDGTFSILSALWSDTSLDCVSGKSSNGTKVQIYTANGTKAQKWTFISEDEVFANLDSRAAASKADLADGTYVISSNKDNSKVVDVASGSTKDSANVQMYESNGTQAQKWTITHNEKGYATIINVKSGKALDVKSATAVSGTNVQQYTSNSTRAQQWIIEKNSDGSYTLSSALWKDLALNIASGDPKNGSNVNIANASASDPQKFVFYDTNPVVDPCTDLGFGDKYFSVSSAVNKTFALDVLSGSTSDGANVQVYTGNNTYAQLYKLQFVSDGLFSSTGYYQLICSGSDMAVAVDFCNVVNGANIVQHTANSSDASQLWSVRANGDGSYTFVNKGTGLAMETASDTLANGTNIQGYAPSGKTRQSFVLSEVTDFLPEGYVTISSKLKSSMVVDVASGSTADGANVQLYSSNGTQAQKWMVTLQGEGSNTYTIQSIYSGKNLAVESNGNVDQRTPNANDPKQQWQPRISKGYTVLQNVATGKVLDVASGKTSNGTNIQTYSFNGSDAQLFKFASTDLVAKSTYYIKPVAASSKVLDVINGKTNVNGTNVQLYGKNDSGAQKWKVEKVSGDYYTITNVVNSKRLELSGSTVQINAASNSDSQKWKLEYSIGGGIIITSKANPSMALTVSDSSFAQNARIGVANKANLSTQKFTFEQTTYVPSYVGSSYRSMYLKAYSYTSKTDWLVLIDRGNHLLGVFKGNKDDWTMVKQLRCTTGKPSTPTPRGISTITTRYYYHSQSYWRTVFWYGQYGIHSVIRTDAELGQSTSGGCVRINRNEAIWVFNNVPNGTTVVVY